ncbi:MAG: hypothetical protein KBB32_09185 [Spirochaetia bacterium]|nr:hypothetical protein [Spirochaetia bacterium]
MAITLQHEAYRDGIKSWDNKAETYQAVLAHTLMAMKLDGVAKNYMDQSLFEDVQAYMDSMNGGPSFASYVGDTYDSGSDFWKLRKDGSLEWDGKFDLVDEEDRPIETDTTGSFSRSLAHYMGRDFNTAEEASAWVQKELGGKWEDGKWKLGKTASATADRQARYEMQWKYVDKVHTDYHGSMVAAIGAMRKDLQAIFSKKGALSDKERFLAGVLDEALIFGQAYDDYLYGGGETDQGLGYLNSGLRSNYESKAGIRAIRQVIAGMRAGDYTDSNALYDHYVPGGILFNVGVKSSKVSTKSRYKDDTPHGFNNGLDGLAVDLTYVDGDPHTMLGYPVYTTQYEQFFTGKSIRWDSRTDHGYGRQIRTFTADGMTTIYGHLQNNTAFGAISKLMNMDALAGTAGIYAFALPPGTMIGTVGYTGHCDPSGIFGTHLHYEWRPSWQW